MSGVGEGRLALRLGTASTLALVIAILLFFAYVFMLIALSSVIKAPHSLVLPGIAVALILMFHGVLRFLARRGDNLELNLVRQPPGNTPEVTYELKYRFKTVLTGAFGPELLRIASYWQQLYPAGGGHVFQLIFRPDPPATMVHARYSEGIPLFESREPKECLEQAVELLKVLKYDPAELEARIQEVTVVLPAPPAPAAPPAGDDAGRS
jgi:hypothetical protein